MAIIIDEYDPDLDLTRTDVLLDGGGIPFHANNPLPLSPEWRLWLTVICIIVFIAYFGWAFWHEYRQGHRWF